MRALVDRNNIDAVKIIPTGPGGRLLKGSVHIEALHVVTVVVTILYSDVLDYLQHRGSHDAVATPTTIVKWRTPPTVGEMWSQPPEHLV